MTAAALLYLAVLAADAPSAVRAKVLYGTGLEDEQRADIELWISQAVAKNGSPLAKPYTGWIALTGDKQRLFMGEFFINGKASDRNGKYRVEINGCDGGPLQAKVTLKPGERRVIYLTDDPPPNNVFIALVAPMSEMAMNRAKLLKASARTFRLQLDFNGDEDKPYYRLTLSVPLVPDRSNSFYRSVQISEDQAGKIIDHLAADEFLEKANDLRLKAQYPPYTMPGYTLTATAEEAALIADLGWGLSMTNRLDGLRKMLVGDAAKEMDLLLGRLSGLRAQWEKEAKDVYIPRDLDDCLAELKRILSKEEVEDIRADSEEAMIDYHYGLGTRLRNNWGLWDDSRLSKWFNERGITHPDDMSGIILHSFWRHLNGKPIKLDEQIKHYQDYWKAVEEDRKKQEKREHESPTTPK